MKKLLTFTIVFIQISASSFGFSSLLPAQEISNASAYYFEDIYAPLKTRENVIIVRDPGAGLQNKIALANTLRALLQQENIRDVFQEGAVGDASLAPLRWRFPDTPREKIAGQYLADDNLTAAEYLSLVWKYDFRLSGAEDPILYLKTSAQYDLVKKNWSDLSPSLNKFENSLAILRSRNIADQQSQRHLDQITENIASLRSFLSFQGTTDDYSSLKHKFSKKQMNAMYFLLQNMPTELTEPVSFPLVTEKEVSIVTQDAMRFYRMLAELDNTFIKSILKESRERRSKKFAVIVGSERLSSLKGSLKNRRIGYSVAVTPSSVYTQDTRFDKRTLRTRMAYDLAYDNEPKLWQLMQNLGLSHRQSLEMLTSFADADTVNISRRLGIETPEFSWLQSRLHADAWQKPAREKELKSADFLFQKTLDQFDDKFSRSTYSSYKRFVDERERPKVRTQLAELQYAEQKLRRFENQTQYAAKVHQSQVNGIFSKKPEGRTYFDLLSGRVHDLMRRIVPTKPKEAMSFRPDPAVIERTVQFLRTNLSTTGLPLGYATTPGYWDKYKSMMNTVDSVMERLLIRYGVSIYDAGLWQIALASRKDARDNSMIKNYTNRLISGRSGELDDIRAYGPIFKYGADKKNMPRENAFFFRIISDRYIQEDPHDRKTYLEEFPNMASLHHEDWKPITGEQAWGAIIGPLQAAYLKHGGNIPLASAEVKLAVSILPAIEAMQSGIGGLYHAPGGTHQKNPDDISNENNFSMYAALRMLDSVVNERSPFLSSRIRLILKRQEEYFKKYAFNPDEGIFYQGGLYMNGKLLPSNIFSVDCQTWGILALGPAWIDRYFGEGTSYRLWKNSKERSGYFNEEGQLEGVGFVDGHKTLSIEWTCGAILALTEIADEYKESHPDWAREAQLDLVSMRHAMEKYTSSMSNGSHAYWYANKRFFIPFGWWANPIPSTASSAWMILIDTGFNPFILGGGEHYSADLSKAPSYYAVTIKEVKKLTKAEPAKSLKQRLRDLFGQKDAATQRETLKTLPVSHKPYVSAALNAMQPRYDKPEADIIFSPRRLFQHAIEESPLDPRRINPFSFTFDLRWLILALATMMIAASVLFLRKTNRSP